MHLSLLPTHEACGLISPGLMHGGTEAPSWLSDMSRVHSPEVAWPGLNVDLQGWDMWPLLLRDTEELAHGTELPWFCLYSFLAVF